MRQVVIKEKLPAVRPVPITPISELGCILVLTQALARPLPNQNAIDRLSAAAKAVGWHPVGDVLRTAVERCLARNHLHANNRLHLTITRAGRAWLRALLSQRSLIMPEVGHDLLFACQLSVLAMSPAIERRKLLDAIVMSLQQQQDHLFPGDHATQLKGWRDFTQARLIAEYEALAAMSQRRKPPQPTADQLATATKGLDSEYDRSAE